MTDEQLELIDELIDEVVDGTPVDEVYHTWKKKTSSQRARIRRQRKRRKFKVKDPKKSRIMKKAMRRWARSKTNVTRAARRRSRY